MGDLWALKGLIEEGIILLHLSSCFFMCLYEVTCMGY